MPDRDGIDGFFDDLTEHIQWVASTSARQEFDGALPNEVDLAAELGRLARRVIPEHNRRLLIGEPVDWAELAETLDRAARWCYRLVIIDPAEDAG